MQILQNSQNEETTVLESLFNNVLGLQSINFIKKGLHHRYFPVDFPVNIFLTEHFRMTASCVYL